MATNLPTGTITFFFTDIENSTKLWGQFPDAMKAALARHDEILRQAIEEHNGTIIKKTGDGFHAAFGSGVSGIQAAIAAQQGLSAEKWETIEPAKLRIRIGLHTGEAEERGGDYYGPTLNRAARLMSVAYGGQTLLSTTTTDLVRDQLPEGLSLRDLGEHRLKDLVRPEHIYQLNHPKLPSDFPPLRSIDAFPNNLPVQLTSFIGREREMEEAKERLNSARLLTMIGPGGTGKTRLALQLAAELLPSFSDGVWVAELAPLADPALILQTIASVLGLREQLGMPLDELVFDYLRAKNILLVVDNCEHLVEACAQLVNQLLHTCSNLKIIASSREALGINGETIFRVPSLSLPEPTQITPDRLMLSESAQLFIVRAAAVGAFTLNEHNAAAVAQICRRLDGIPLALELAAARVTVFSVEQIATRLDDRFKLLTGGSRTALPRQQTLRATIDWGYELLSGDERTLLRKLSVFAGGWSYEAAEAICSTLDVLNLLTQLVNKSLVIVEGQAGEVRYYLLETVRQYASDKLVEMGEAAQARDSHFNYFFELTGKAAPKLVGSEALGWVLRLEMELDNIRAALGWGLENNVEAVLKMLTSLLYFWNRRGLEEEGRRLISEALSEALSRANQLPKLEGEADRRRKLSLGEAWHCLAMLAYSQGDNARAIESSNKASALARELGNKRLLALALAFRASGELWMGNTEGVEALLEEGIAAARESGDKYATGLPLALYGQGIALTKGDYETAGRYINEGAALLRESGDDWGATMALLSIGMTAKFRGDYNEARKQFAACEPIFRDLGDRHRVNMVKSELAHIERYEGHYEKAEAMYRETLPEWQRIGHRAAIAHQLECLATIAKVREQGPRAARLFGAAEALRDRINIPMTPLERREYEDELANLRAGMDHDAFDAAWAEGRAMSMEQAISYALEKAPLKTDQ
jgi:predicted ATPase/class 3 adenylate cyclase